MIATILFLSNAVFAANPPAGNYQIDTGHTKIGFGVKHMMISTVEGSFKKFEGSIQIKEKFTDSSVNATVDVNSIDTNMPKRDEHLRTPDFFNVAKKGNDKMTFKSMVITGTPEAFKMTGDLTINGKTKKTTFDGVFGGAVIGKQKEQRVGFSASTKISRKDFGIAWNQAVEAGPIVGDEVTITLSVEATKLETKPAK